MSNAKKISSLAEKIGDRFYKKKYGKIWMCLCFQTVQGGLFSSKEEAKSSHNETMYSIIGEIYNSSKINGKFEFLYEAEFNFYYIWRQSNYPLYEAKKPENSGKNAEGYDEIHVKYFPIVFGGMRASTVSESLIDGAINYGNYHYSAGTLKNSYNSLVSSSSGESGISFWMRVLPASFMSCRINKQKNLLSIQLIILCFIS